MKSLYLVRHAKSDWNAEWSRDHDRPLSKRGQRAAPAIAEYMSDEGLDPEVVLCSTATRTRQTWEAMEPILGSDATVFYAPELYGASPQGILATVATVDPDVERVMVVAHNPGVEALAWQLADSGPEDQLDALHYKFPTAGLAVLTAEVDSWEEIEGGRCHLERFVTPKSLPGSKSRRL